MAMTVLAPTFLAISAVRHVTVHASSHTRRDAREFGDSFQQQRWWRNKSQVKISPAFFWFNNIGFVNRSFGRPVVTHHRNTPDHVVGCMHDCSLLTWCSFKRRYIKGDSFVVRVCTKKPRRSSDEPKGQIIVVPMSGKTQLITQRNELKSL